MKLADIAVADVLSYWYDTGAFGYQMNFVRVIKVGKKKVRVKTEHGQEVWKYPDFFHGKMSAKSIAELQADGVKI